MATLPPLDTLIIQGIDLPVQIGVPDDERASWQSLCLDLELHLVTRVESLDDDIRAAVDYDTVTRQVRALATLHPRCLIETLAAEIAAHLLSTYSIAAVDLTLRKKILPGVEHVAIRIHRRI